MFKPWFSEADEQAMQRRPEAYVAVLWGARELLRTGKRRRIGAAIADAGVAVFGPVVKWWRPLCEEAVANLLDARALPGALAAQYASRPRHQVIAKHDEHPEPERAAALLDEAGRYLVDDYEHRHLVGLGPTWGFAPGAGTTVLSLPEAPGAWTARESGRHYQGAELPALSWLKLSPLPELVEKLRTFPFRRHEVLEVSLVDDPPDPNARIQRPSMNEVGLDLAAEGMDLAVSYVAGKIPERRIAEVCESIAAELGGGHRLRPARETSIARQLFEPLPMGVKLKDRWKPARNPDGTQTWHRPLDGPERIVTFLAPAAGAGRRLYVPGLDTGDFETNPVVVWAHDYGAPPVGRLVKQDDCGERTWRVELAPEHVTPKHSEFFLEEVHALEVLVNRAAVRPRCPKCRALVRVDLHLGTDAEEKPDATSLGGLRGIRFTRNRAPRGLVYCESRDCGWQADLFEPGHECPTPPAKTSLGLIDCFLGMVDMPTEHREAFRAQFHVPMGWPDADPWTKDEERAFSWLRQDAIARLLDERRGRLLDKLTENHREDERDKAGGVPTTLGGIGFWKRDAGGEVLDVMPLKQWRDEVKGRWCVIELPNETAVPAWAIAAVLQAAPADAFIEGVQHEFTTNTIRIRVRSLAFPRTLSEGYPMPAVQAELDYTTCTAKVSWPLREDLENPKP